MYKVYCLVSPEIYTHGETITKIKIIKISIIPQNLHVYLCTHPSCLLGLLSPISRQPQICSLSLWINLNFLEFYVNEVIEYKVFFLVQLLSRRNILRFTHVVGYHQSPFFFMTQQYTMIRMYYNVFNYSVIGGHLGHFQFLVQVKLLNICMLIFVWKHASISLR